MSDNDGGPAFPHSFEYVDNHPLILQARGMTLRDYFASSALNGLLSRASSAPILSSKMAYEIADAMIAARDAKP